MGTHSSEAMISRSAILGSAILALSAAEEIPFLETALEVVSRASTSSEVLSLNLTNLIILIALKVAIVVFGLVSGGGVTGRSGEAPVAADNYLSAAKMWYKMHKLIQAVPFSEKYNVVMETLYDASEHAKSGGNCSKYNW